MRDSHVSGRATKPACVPGRGTPIASPSAGPQPHTSSELAIYANGSLSALSRAVARLERRGWVKRTPDPTDGRYTLATLTDDGRAVLVAAAPGHVEAVNRLVFDPLTGAQARQLRTIAGRILNAIEAEGGTTPQPRP